MVFNYDYDHFLRKSTTAGDLWPITAVHPISSIPKCPPIFWIFLIACLRAPRNISVSLPSLQLTNSGISKTMASLDNLSYPVRSQNWLSLLRVHKCKGVTTNINKLGGNLLHVFCVQYSAPGSKIKKSINLLKTSKKYFNYVWVGFFFSLVQRILQNIKINTDI